MKILLVDDEESIKVLVEMLLTEEGYDFYYAADGEEALNKLASVEPDLIIMDVMMSKLNGFEVCQKIRELGSNVPIIILSAKGDIVDKSVGFKAGADDYLVKPFSPVELLLRIKALLRRRYSVVPIEKIDRYVSSDLEICFNGHDVKIGGETVDLTPTEFKILAYLASNAGEVFSREQLQSYIWGENYIGEPTGIAVYIRKIREKIEENPSKPEYLLTVWGVGYKFSEE